MLQPQRKIIRRMGFTLIEIIVVIAIIGVLVALLVPAVMQVLRVGPQTQTATEIQQLDGAIQNFKTTMGASYLPSQIMLCENFHVYSTVPASYAQLAQDSINYLTTLFPHILDPDPVTGIVQWNLSPQVKGKGGAGIDWNGDGVIDGQGFAGQGYVILEGHQCLVFFLGGIPTGLAQDDAAVGNRNGPPGCLGFSANPRDPANLADFKQNPVPARKGPFFDFDKNQARLIDMYVISDGTGIAKTKKGYYSFLDIYSLNSNRLDPGPGTGPNGRTSMSAPTRYATPYAYFSNYGSKNNYNKYSANPDCYNLGVTLTNPTAPIVKGQYGVQPYSLATAPATRYYNPDTWQIICAGEDGMYGAGNLMAPGSQPPPFGPDDQANFTGGGKLIAGVNN